MYALARDFPHLQFSLNGGLELSGTAASALSHAPPSGGRIQGVMIGRGAYNMPWPSLACADHAVFQQQSAQATRRQVRDVQPDAVLLTVLLTGCSYHTCTMVRLLQLASHLAYVDGLDLASSGGAARAAPLRVAGFNPNITIIHHTNAGLVIIFQHVC